MNGNNLKENRLSIGLSQGKLADLSGIAQAKISAFELGKSHLSFEQISILENTLKQLDGDDVVKINKKRFHKVADGARIIESLPRRSFSRTHRNPDYLRELESLEIAFSKGRDNNKPKAISFFAGCGGLCYGIKAAGFDVIAANELVDSYREIYAENFPDVTFLPNDIRDIKSEHLLDYVGVDLMIGGPPCQGFSLAGKRDVNDDRNSLFRDYLNIADIVKPKVVLMENVKLLTSMKDPNGHYVKDRILETFNHHGYTSKFYELNAKHYGVPQDRQRVFFVGVRKDLNIVPSRPNLVTPEECDFFTSGANPYSFGDATSDLAFLESSEKSSTDHYHWAVNHPEHVLRWLADVKQGKSAHDNVEKNLRPPSGYNTTYKRQVWNEPASTVATTFGMISGCRNVHPIATRSLTIREALRLQSFPDSFKLKGKNGDIRTTIGNAVPPKLAYEIGRHLLNTIFYKNSPPED